MSCEYCKPRKLIYEDDKTAAFMSDEPATIGHLVVIPKNHAPILEALDDGTTEKLFLAANKVSLALLESIKCEGTNIIINNGIEAGQDVPHISIQVLSRRNDDGIFFEWAGKKLTEEQMATIELQLKEELAKPVAKKEELIKEPKQDSKQESKPSADKTSDAKPAEAKPEDAKPKEAAEESYLTRQLRRIP
jgi:histidine triad (HIT) family protein